VTNSGIAYFRSSQDLTGQNPSTVNQIFSLSQADGARRQLTNFTGATNLGNVRLNGDGSTIYLTSTTNLTGDYSAGVRQVYSFDTNSPGFRRLTNFSSSPAGTLFLSRDGGRLFSTNGGNLDMYDVTLEGTSIDFEVGSGAAGNIAGTISALSSAIRGLGAFGLSSQLSARASLERISKNLEQLNSARGTLGALTSRLGSASNIVKSRRDEFLAAAGRIKDANMATETSNLIRQQILQQVGTSGLAQARRAPELALQLLR
jgi:flagellin